MSPRLLRLKRMHAEPFDERDWVQAHIVDARYPRWRCYRAFHYRWTFEG